MADKSARKAKNVAGKYYVDASCVGCGQCIDIASNFFADSPEDGVYVKLQPSTDNDVSLCEQALTNCPVASIGNDD